MATEMSTHLNIDLQASIFWTRLDVSFARLALNTQSKHSGPRKEQEPDIATILYPKTYAVSTTGGTIPKIKYRGDANYVCTPQQRW